MDEQKQKYLLLAVGVLVVIIVAVAAAHFSGGNGSTDTTTSSSISDTNSTNTTETTSTPTVTTIISYITTEITSTGTKTQVNTNYTQFTTVSTEFITSTSTYTILHTYVIPTNYILPITGNFFEKLQAYGISVKSTTYNRFGILQYNGNQIILAPAIGSPITITPVYVSGAPTTAIVKIGDKYGEIPLEFVNAIKDAFNAPQLDNLQFNDETATALFTTYIAGREVAGTYVYYPGRAELTITIPWSYTIDGVIFNVDGTYSITYTIIAGETREIGELASTVITTSIKHTSIKTSPLLTTETITTTAIITTILTTTITTTIT